MDLKLQSPGVSNIITNGSVISKDDDSSINESRGLLSYDDDGNNGQPKDYGSASQSVNT